MNGCGDMPQKAASESKYMQKYCKDMIYCYANSDGNEVLDSRNLLMGQNS